MILANSNMEKKSAALNSWMFTLIVISEESGIRVSADCALITRAEPLIRRFVKNLF